MKIVLFGNSTWCLWNFRETLMRRLLGAGHEVIALAPEDPTYDNQALIQKIESIGVRFVPVQLKPRNLNPLGEVLALLDIFRTLRSLRPDLVLSYTIKCNLYAGFCRLGLNFVQIANIPGLGEVFERSGGIQRLVRALYRVAFRGMGTAFFQNPEDLRICVERKLVSPEICSLLPGSGVNLNRFSPTFPGRDPERRVFLMFGRVLPQKGYGHYLAAAEHLHKVFGERVQCWVLGIPDQNRPASLELYDQLREADARGVLRVLPQMVDVKPVLDTVDVVVLPSCYNEGVPRSLLEAMSCGKAIITTDWKGCRETVEHGKNGYLIDPDSTEALVQAMLKVAEKDVDELAAMGRESRRIAEERYDEELIVSSYFGAMGERAEQAAPASLEAQAQLRALPGRVSRSSF